MYRGPTEVEVNTKSREIVRKIKLRLFFYIRVTKSSQSLTLSPPLLPRLAERNCVSVVQLDEEILPSARCGPWRLAATLSILQTAHVENIYEGKTNNTFIFSPPAFRQTLISPLLLRFKTASFVYVIRYEHAIHPLKPNPNPP